MKLNKDKMWFNAKLTFKYITTFLTIAVAAMTFMRYLKGETDITIASLVLGISIILVGSLLVTVVIILFSLKDFYEEE
ncbi:hypothetical protein N7931_14625 [Catenovulum sp. 2E275]|uniref:hypothetical protein n=1 Tax=Catenovulum sp. 2E275 TaxID=2980497 RepID=UPI0021D2F205|nr:hypothetical protein [Catenovulum sp. 2E275]MCU4676865.1 hypothetical protein [Catenovulum sp. 2E275]